MSWLRERMSPYLTAVTLVLLVLGAAPVLASSEDLSVPKEIQAQISTQFKTLAEVENRFNPVDYVERSAEPFWLEHYEIPLRLVQSTFAKSDKSPIVNSLIFNKNGELWVRWIPNSLDTMYKPQVIEFMKAHGLDPTPQKRFVGFTTASRSILVFDPVTRAEFSVKAPTNATPGLWKDKPEPVRVGKAVSLVSAYAHRIYSEADPSQKLNSEVINEPGAILIDGIDQAMVIRDYPHTKNRLLIPLFAFFHNDYGKRLASVNGYENPVEFNKDKVLKIWVQALAQHYLLTGLVSNSSHGQNYLIEVDSQFRLTGKIFHRDFADANLNRKLVSANGGDEVLKLYETFSSNTIGEKNFHIMLQPFKSVQPSELLPWASRLHKLSVSMKQDLNAEFTRHLGSEFTVDQTLGEFTLRSESNRSYYDGALHFPINISDEGYRLLAERNAFRVNQCSELFSF